MLRNNKKLMAAAIASVLGFPMLAQAQESSVTIYGRLYPQIDRYSYSGATAPGFATSTLVGPITAANQATQRGNPSGTVMESSNSRLGFRGVEGLGGGLKGLFQLEMALGVDDGSLPTAGVLFSRDSFVGLSGGFGTVRLGNMDTVYKNLGDTLSFLGISSGNIISTSNILSKPGIGSAATGTSSASSFHLRRANSVIYESPEIAGFQGLVDYSFGEVTGNTRSGAVFSTGVKYDQGPIYVALAYEQHNDLFGGSKNVTALVANPTTGAVVTSKDTGTRLTVQYRVTPEIRIEGNAARLDYREQNGAVGRFSEYKTNTYSLGADYKMGAYNFAGSAGRASAGNCSLVGGAACSTNGLSGKMVNLGVGYSLSKRTMLYAIGSKMFNDGSAQYGNNNQAPKGTVGQELLQLALGVRHDF